MSSVAVMEEAMDLRISWYTGFGWMSVVIVVLCGIGINVTQAPAVLAAVYSRFWLWPFT